MKDGGTRYENKALVDKAISDWTSKHTKREVMETIASAKVPCGAVLNMREQLDDEDLHQRGIMAKIDHPVRGEMIVPASPIQMSNSKVDVTTAPLHGSSNEEVYGEWLGYSAEEVAKMREDKII